MNHSIARHIAIMFTFKQLIAIFNVTAGNHLAGF